MESFIVRFNILDDIACITNTIEKDTEYTPVVSIVIELFNGFRVVPLAGPGMVKLIFVLTTAENRFLLEKLLFQIWEESLNRLRQ